MKTKTLLFLVLSLAMVSTSCGDSHVDEPHAHNHEEVITTVALTFSGEGDDIKGAFRDADGDGGDEPTTDAITLPADTTLTLDIELLNELVDQMDEEYEIGKEIAEEAEEHQIFFSGTIFDGGVTHAYADKESDYTTNNVGDDLPVGLKSTIVTTGAGSGTLIVTLKHQPPVNDTETKTATSTINDGDSDIEVTFNVTVE